jgi:hypothetical protein
MSRELEGLSLLNYQREENDEHGGKEPRSAQVGDWMPILTIQPKFDALVLGSLGLSIARWPTSRMHSRNRLANGMRPPSVAQYDILSANIAISIRAPSSIVERPSPRSAGPLPHRSEHTPHPRLPQAISPVASSRKVYTPEPSSFPQGRPIGSLIIMLEEGQPPILLVHSNTR